MSYCFAVSTSQSQDDFQGKALQIKRGFMVGLHFLKQRDVPTWVKNAQLHKQGDLNSSFEELGNMIGEIVACKMTGTTEPVLNYPEHSITSAANWNYVFVKRCIAEFFGSKKPDLFETQDSSIYDDVEKVLIKGFQTHKDDIASAKKDSKAYINGLNLSPVLGKIRESLNNGDWRMHMPPPPPPGTDKPRHKFGKFFGIEPFKVFPSLRLRASLPQDIQNWWQPAPPLPPQRDQANGKCSGGKCHGHFGGPHHGPEAYWFEEWLPDNAKKKCMKSPFPK